MAISQNGWPILRVAPPYITIPGTNARMRVAAGPVAEVFTELITRFHNEVENIDLYKDGDEWGWYIRNVRGSERILSNHSSGTAVDLNATRHPRGTPATAGFTNQQMSAIRVILDDMDGVIRFGGDFHTVSDPMHWEINANLAAVERLADKIRKQHQARAAKEDDVSFKDTHKLTDADVKAYGGDAKVGDEKSYDELIRFSPDVARLRREFTENSKVVQAQIAGLTKLIQQLLVQKRP